MLNHWTTREVPLQIFKVGYLPPWNYTVSAFQCSIFFMKLIFNDCVIFLRIGRPQEWRDYNTWWKPGGFTKAGKDPGAGKD